MRMHQVSCKEVLIKKNVTVQHDIKLQIPSSNVEALQLTLPRGWPSHWAAPHHLMRYPYAAVAGLQPLLPP